MIFGCLILGQIVYGSLPFGLNYDKVMHLIEDFTGEVVWATLSQLLKLLCGLIFCSSVACSFGTVEAAIRRQRTPSCSSIPLYDNYWFTVSANWWLWWEINFWRSMVVSPSRYSLFLQGLQSYCYYYYFLVKFSFWLQLFSLINCANEGFLAVFCLAMTSS